MHIFVRMNIHLTDFPEILSRCYATSERNRYIRGNGYNQLPKHTQQLANQRIDPLLYNVRIEKTSPW
jgi:hypothetical protein